MTPTATSCRIKFRRWHSKQRKVVFTVLNQVVFRQTLQAGCISQTLGDQKTYGEREFFFLSRLPAMAVLKEGWKSRFFQRFLEIFVSDLGESDKIETEGKKENFESDLLVSLLMTSTYFFMSSTSGGSFALKILKGDDCVPSSTKLPPGWRRLPTKMISKRASAYLRNSRVDPACTSFVATESKSPGVTVSRCL